MMQRIWAAIAATWAVIAIFAVLAFARPAPAAPVGGGVVLARAANGQVVPVSSGTHATTSSSAVPVAGGAPAVTYVKNAGGSFVPVASSSSAPAAVTRRS